MVSRRQFLRAGFSRTGSARRPPWHVAEASFTTLCTRCNDCARACPSRIIAIGRSGYPEIDFADAECSFCGECARVCASGALVQSPQAVPWDLRAVIGDHCLARHQTVCRSCGDVCAARAIRFSPVLGGAAQPEIGSERCTGCGACVSACPVRAIAVLAPEPVV